MTANTLCKPPSTAEIRDILARPGGCDAADMRKGMMLAQHAQVTRSSGIVELLHQGDWAIAYRDKTPFLDVCSALAESCVRELADELERARRLVDIDFSAAAQTWAMVARRLRAELRCP